MSSFTLPTGCKPSAALSTDPTRPMLTCAYLRKLDGALWLFATDAYIAVGIKVEGDAEEGFISAPVLKQMEKATPRRNPLTFEQIDLRTWKVTGRGFETIYTADVHDDAQYPSLHTTADGAMFGLSKLGIEAPFGFNPELTARVGKALGCGSGPPLQAELNDPLKPMRLSVGGFSGGRVGLVMPVRLFEEERTDLRAAA